MQNIRFKALDGSKRLQPPPLHIANVLAHHNILMREIDRALNFETGRTIRKDLKMLKLYGVMMREKMGRHFDVGDVN